MVSPATTVLLPDAPSVVAGHGQAAVLSRDGELLMLGSAEAARLLQDEPPPFMVHAPATQKRLGIRTRPALDLLELFAFVLPLAPFHRRRADWRWHWI